MTDPARLIPAATTVLVRDGDDGIEVLLARRNSKLAFAGGAWVFPGGRIDDEDFVGERADDLDDPALLAAARIAAVREAAEETGAVLDIDTLVWFAYWTPPPQAPKRFATWFFVGPAPAEVADLRADGGEIHELAWRAPADAMARRNAGEIELTPPTWITLEHLTAFATTDEVLTHYGATSPERFETLIRPVDGGMVALYDGDAGYESADPLADGPRHRLWMVQEGWRYERTP